MLIKEIDEIIYCHIDDQHEDTLRFVKDCEAWFEREVKVIQSPYCTVENVIRSKRFITRSSSNGSAGCSDVLKKRLRKEWERDNQDKIITYVWGLDFSEKQRCKGITKAMPDTKHRFPLIEQEIDKTKAHQMLTAANITRPIMYDLGYLNNNCIGCVRGSIGYWNKIRVDFPDVFWSRAALEREINATCLKDFQWLDELDLDRGRKAKPICPECGVMCNLYRKELE